MSGYITLDVNTEADFYVSDVLEQIDDKYLRNEVIRRELSVRGNIKVSPVEDYKPGQFRRILCDMLSLGYQVSDDEILSRIKESL